MLRVDSSRPEPVWGVTRSGMSFGIVWPPGFTLTPGEEPTVLDPDGRTIGRDGDVIDDAEGSGGEPITICGVAGRVYDLD